MGVQEAEEYAEEDKMMKEVSISVTVLRDMPTLFETRSVMRRRVLLTKSMMMTRRPFQEAIREVLDWIDDNQEADAEEYDEKQKELEGIANPIMQKIYQQAGGAPGDDDFDDDFDDDDFDHDDL